MNSNISKALILLAGILLISIDITLSAKEENNVTSYFVYELNSYANDSTARVNQALTSGIYNIVSFSELLNSFSIYLMNELSSNPSEDEKNWIEKQLTAIKCMIDQDLELMHITPIIGTLRSTLTGLDKNTRIFDHDSLYTEEKYWVLIGDFLRQEIEYPVFFSEEDRDLETAASKAYLADHLVYNNRSFAPQQVDLGSFSRSDFSHITPISKKVTITSQKDFRAAGVYALPGTTVRVTRLDNNSTLNTNIFVNTVRSGSTKEFSSGSYHRPKFLQSAKMKIKEGETLEFTSVYGGPIQIEFNVSNLQAEFLFENIGQHAFWAYDQDNSKFNELLESDHLDWAEVSTRNGFEIHSKSDKMRATIRNWEVPTIESVAKHVDEYIGHMPFLFAGYRGQNIKEVEAISGWADSLGLKKKIKDQQIHMNADQASCGSGCSGNPYDTFGAMEVIGFGDIHEVGHGLERGRIGFSNWVGHAYTNIYVYYTRSRYNLENTIGDKKGGKILPYEHIYNAINSNIDQPKSIIKKAIETSETAHIINIQSAVYTQALFLAHKYGDLSRVSMKDSHLKQVNGWHLHSRMHLLEHNIGHARSNETNWQDLKSRLGFDQYSLQEYRDITNAQHNDWMLVSLSHAAKLDYRPFFDMYGEEYSDKASSQVESFNYEPVPYEFVYVYKGNWVQNKWWGPWLDKPTIPVDGKWAFRQPLIINYEDTLTLYENISFQLDLPIFDRDYDDVTIEINHNDYIDVRVDSVDSQIFHVTTNNVIELDSLVVKVSDGTYITEKLFYVRSLPYMDEDIDGVVDSDDYCPNTPSGELIDKRGCNIEQVSYYSPSKFNLLQPVDGFVLDSQELEFRWQESEAVDPSDSIYYKIEIAKDSLFTEIFHNEMVFSDTMLIMYSDIFEEYQYYWKVIANDNRGFISESQRFGFMIDKSSTSNEFLLDIPDEYSLSQNYPNPFNPTTQINFDLPEDANVKIEIFNSIGQQAAELINTRMSAGYHTVSFNASGLSSGVYLYKLTTPSFTQTKKMLLIK